MNFNEYQQQAMKFRLPSASPMYAVLNLGAEAGEVQSKVAKIVRDGEPESTEAQKAWDEDLAKELGDVLWGVAAIAEDNGFTLEDIAKMNITKLEDRKSRGVLSGSGDHR